MATDPNRNRPSQVDRGCADPSDEPAVLGAARALLGRIIVGHGVAAAITEVEAYNGPDDPASHAFKRTKRSEIMYGPPYRLYVYQIHTHHCANVVTSPLGQGAAVLLRAARIVDGLETARARRGDVPDQRLARGPGNLTRALGITKADLDTDLLDETGVHLRDAGTLESGPSGSGPSESGSEGSGLIAAPRSISAGPRVGVRLAADRPWRFWITDDPSVSPYRRHPRAEPA